jgi:1-acyl-sn-glycerol-3-phosphate acyltransferase
MPNLSDLVHFVCSNLLCLWMRVGYRVTVRRARTRPWGPVLYAANHRSFLDPPMVGMWSPVPVAYFARASLWRNPLFRFMLDTFSGIPVERENPGISSMKGAIERLRAGIPVLVFPEGTRTRDGRIGRLKDGPALFARRAQVPLVPVYVHRTERCWGRESILPHAVGPRLEVRFGSPLVAPAGLPPREQDAWLSSRLEAWLRRQERELTGIGLRQSG